MSKGFLEPASACKESRKGEDLNGKNGRDPGSSGESRNSREKRVSERNYRGKEKEAALT